MKMQKLALECLLFPWQPTVKAGEHVIEGPAENDVVITVEEEDYDCGGEAYSYSSSKCQHIL